MDPFTIVIMVAPSTEPVGNLNPSSPQNSTNVSNNPPQSSLSSPSISVTGSSTSPLNNQSVPPTQNLDEDTEDFDEESNPFLNQNNEEDDGGIKKSGYLTKEGGNIKNWKKRWFELYSDEKVLKYYINPNNRKLKGSISIEGTTVCEHVDESRSNCFKIIGKGRTYFLQADNKEGMFDWLEALQSVGAYYVLPEISERDKQRAKELGIYFDDDTLSTTSTLTEANNKKYKKSRSLRSDKGNSFRYENDSESNPFRDEDVELPKDLIYHSDDDADLYNSSIPLNIKNTPKKQNNDKIAPKKKQEKKKKSTSPIGPVEATPVKVKVLNPEINDQMARNSENYLQEAFSNIAIIPKEEEKLNTKQIEKQYRRTKMKERTEYDTPDEEDGNDLEKERLRREKEFVKEFSGFVNVDNPLAKQALDDQKKSSSFNYFLDIFRMYPYSTGTYILSVIIIFMACLFYFLADWVPRILLFNKNNVDNYQSYQITEGLIYFFRSLFIDQNRGAFSIVASLETAISESGTFLQNYYLKGGDKNSLLLNGYVGRILQLSSYSAVLSSIITIGFCFIFIGFYMDFLGQSELISSSRLYILSRAPGIILYFISCQFQSIMLGTLRMWEWAIWNTLTFSIFLLTSYIFLSFIQNGLMTMALCIDIAFFISVLTGILIFALPTFRNRHDPFNFSQSFETVGRFSKLSIFTLIATSGPILLDFLYNSIKSSQDQLYSLSLTAVNTPLALFLQYGFLFNGIALVLGARCAKRFRYKEFAYLILKSIVNLLCVVLVYFILFVSFNMHERSVRIVIGEFIADSIERENILTKLISFTKPMWYSGLLSVPVILLNNLYQTYFFCFEKYTVLITINLSTTILIGLPGLILTIFTFETLEGWYYIQIAQNGVACVIYMILLHCFVLPSFHKAELEEKLRRIEGETNHGILENSDSSINESDIEEFLKPEIKVNRENKMY